jgi:preprotein translocase subunit SecY
VPSIVLTILLPDQSAAIFSFSGTSVLIGVGVALETMKQVDSQLMMRNYEGFLT